MEPKAYDVQTVLRERLLPLSKKKLYEMINSKGIQTVRAGRKILIPAWAIDEFLARIAG